MYDVLCNIPNTFYVTFIQFYSSSWQNFFYRACEKLIKGPPLAFYHVQEVSSVILSSKLAFYVVFATVYLKIM